MKVVLGYPTKEEEKSILRSNVRPEGLAKPNKMMSPDDIVKARALVKEVYLDEKIENYILDLVFATREPEKFGMTELKPYISFGCSPRASINLAIASKAYAFLQGRAFVIPDAVRAIAFDVMAHRMGVTYEAEAENLTAKEVLVKIMNRVEVP
jgi:MoxR-like ATPase